MINLPIKEIRLEYKIERSRPILSVIKGMFHNRYNLYIVTTSGMKIPVFEFALTSKNIHGIKFKHRIIEKIINSDAIALLNINNKKDSTITKFASLKISSFAKENINIYKVEDEKEKSLTGRERLNELVNI